MGATEIWILIGVNTLLLGITGFFVKQWINSVKEDNQENRDKLDSHKESADKEIGELKREVGKRKGETELLRKDLELLSSETRKNFESMSIHMNYQKTALDEIKTSVSNRGASELQAILELTKKLNDDKG